MTPTTFEVTANIPGYDGPFVLEVPSTSADAARRRAMFTLMARGAFDPAEGMSPGQALSLFTARAILSRAEIIASLDDLLAPHVPLRDRRMAGLAQMLRWADECLPAHVVEDHRQAAARGEYI